MKQKTKLKSVAALLAATVMILCATPISVNASSSIYGDFAMRDLFDNGYVIQRMPMSGYFGIDGDNWYLNYCSENSYFEEFHDNHIGIGWRTPAFVECCTDWEYMQRCIEESQKLGIRYRVLLCSTERTEPQLKNVQKGKVLGFDCAYSGGSYYSCILNDIISGRIEEFHQIPLNENGLFSTYEEAKIFMRKRAELMKKKAGYVFEEGDYVIYKITEEEI